MKVHRLAIVFSVLSLVCPALHGQAQDPVPLPDAAQAQVPAQVPAQAQAPEAQPDPDLPQPFDAAAYLPMLKNPPFNRVVNYTDSLLLTGVAWVEGRPMATLLDKTTKRHYVVSDAPNAQGWRLADASMGNDLHGTEIKLDVGGETVTIRYSDAQLNPERKDGKTLTMTGAQTGGGDNNGKNGGRQRTSAGLSPENQDYYRNNMSKDAKDKFRETMKSHADRLEKMTDDQRSAYTQKVFNKIKTQDQSGQPPAPAVKKAKK